MGHHHHHNDDHDHHDHHHEDEQPTSKLDSGDLGPTYIALALLLGFLVYRYNSQIKAWVAERRAHAAGRWSDAASKRRHGTSRSSTELSEEEMREQIREARLRQQAYVTNATRQDAELRAQRKAQEIAEKAAKQAAANGQQEVASAHHKHDNDDAQDKKKKPSADGNSSGTTRAEFMERLPTLPGGGQRDTYRPSYGGGGGSGSYRPTGFKRMGGGWR